MLLTMTIHSLHTAHTNSKRNADLSLVWFDVRALNIGSRIGSVIMACAINKNRLQIIHVCIWNVNCVGHCAFQYLIRSSKQLFDLFFISDQYKNLQYLKDTTCEVTTTGLWICAICSHQNCLPYPVSKV